MTQAAASFFILQLSLSKKGNIPRKRKNTVLNIMVCRNKERTLAPTNIKQNMRSRYTMCPSLWVEIEIDIYFRIVYNDVYNDCLR